MSEIDLTGDWGLGTGDWGLGIRDWDNFDGYSNPNQNLEKYSSFPVPNPQSRSAHSSPTCCTEVGEEWGRPVNGN
ncbi:MAG: hypothetical protein V7L11_19645 [Nostoc sp.]|uniref:hypothetical protein n=1 Tax=Nostoc sp. TaxID=1180 RepID=UPI002FFA16F8